MGRGPDQRLREEYYAIEPRGPTNGIILQAWINPHSLQRRQSKTRVVTEEGAFQELFTYCQLHLRRGAPEIHEGIPPRPVDSSRGQERILYVRIDSDETVRNRVEGQMRRLGFYTAILHERHLPSEKQRILEGGLV